MTIVPREIVRAAARLLGPLTLSCALVFSSRAAAQRPITFAQALSRASERAPEVAAAAAQAAVAQADVGVAGMLPNPRIGGGASVNYLAIADFYILLPIFGQRETAQDAAAAQARVAEA